MDPHKPASRLIVRLREDEHYLFVDKPSGLSVGTPQQGRPWGLVEALRQIDTAYRELPLQPCYRLDRYTSGVLALAKSTAAAQRFKELMIGGGVVRRYVAVVRGKPKLDRSPAGRDRHRRRQESPYKALKDGTLVRLLKQLDRAAVVSVMPVSGGRARIRAALGTARAPILGDARFDRRPNRTQSGRHYLHLQELRFKHPFKGEPIRVIARPPASFEKVARGQPVIEEHLRVALAARIPYLLDPTTDSFRLLNPRVDGIPGLAADRYADAVILWTQQGKYEAGQTVLRAAAQWYGTTLGLAAVYVKNLPRHANRRTPENLDAETGPKPLWGKACADQIAIRQDGICYLIRPHDGPLVGLFLDHRENRQSLRASAKGKRVLNLFAYTCGFSVAAAAGGAASTTSVDAAKKFLEWGKRNFIANGFELANHRFFCSDVFDYFSRGLRQGHRFDLIILDPPTFSRTKKPARVFQVTKDMVRLIQGALTLLDQPGLMLISTNHRELSTRWIREQIQAAAGSRRFQILPPPPTCLDFAGAREAAKSLWVRF